MVSGDVYTFYVTAAVVGTPTATNVKIAKNGVSFNIDGITYTSSNDEIITLGAYSQ